MVRFRQEIINHRDTEAQRRVRSLSFGAKLSRWREGKYDEREYDFSKTEQGKFYRRGAVIQLPIYLDAKVQAQVERVARKNGKEVSELINQVVQKEMELIEKLTR
ncbi:MAG TPA: hypothetical protein VGK82_03525 [Pyrinomonadaceae bacterium]